MGSSATATSSPSPFNATTRAWSTLGFLGSRSTRPVILQRTLTIHGDVNRVTRPLGIEDRSTIALLLVDGSGHVLWRRAGGFTPLLAHDLEAALTEHHRE